MPGLIGRKRLALEYIRVKRSEIEETGEYDLEGLFIRLDHALRTIRARRIVLDTIESLFAGLSNAGVLRAELRRLFAWLKDRGITAVITGERGSDTLTRQGLEEYVSDCVIFLDHRVTDQISTRRLRVVKYRGSSHGTNEYPFLIDRRGIAVLPVTSLQLSHRATAERVSTGLDWLNTCSAARDTFARAACCSPEGPERRRRRSRGTSSMRRAAAVSGRSVFNSRSRRRNTCATCDR